MPLTAAAPPARPGAQIVRLVGVPVVGLAALAAALLGGADALVSVLIGTVLVAAFFLTGRLPAVLGPDIPRGAAFLLLGMGYVLRVMVLLVAFRLLRDVDWIDRRVLGGTVIVGALLWGAAQLYAHLTSRQPTVVPVPSRPPQSTEDDARAAPGGGAPGAREAAVPPADPAGRG